METKQGNKLIAAFMNVIYHESYGECRDARFDEIMDMNIDTTKMPIEQLREIRASIDEKHQWCPEYQNSYDKMIPVVRQLKRRLKEEFGMSMRALGSMQQMDLSVLYENKQHLFNLLCETISLFNSLTKNSSNGKDHSPPKEIQQSE